MFSKRMKDLHPSPIREILSAATRPGMISFAGGLPSPDTFPEFDLRIPPGQIQYGQTEGDEALRIRICENLTDIGLECAPEQILVISGSQQGIDLVSKLFIDNGTSVAVESPTYLAALQVFRFFGARFLEFSPGRIDFQGEKPAFAYAIPTFQNPSGHCYSASERKALANACDAGGIPLFEDDPYRDLAYSECDRTPVCSMIERASWIYQGSFSKSLAPGLRLGFMASSRDLSPSLARLKQAADLHSSRLGQRLVLDQLLHPARAERLEFLVDFYRRKRDFFAECLEEHFGAFASWKIPEGGLFFWLKLDRCVDTRTLLQQALSDGVAFMPGEHFYPHPEKSGKLRLNFSHASEEQIDRGLGLLAKLLASQRS